MIFYIRFSLLISEQRRSGKETMLFKWATQSAKSHDDCSTRTWTPLINQKTTRTRRQLDSIKSDEVSAAMSHKSGSLLAFSVVYVFCIACTECRPLLTQLPPEGNISETRPPPEDSASETPPTDLKPKPTEGGSVSETKPPRVGNASEINQPLRDAKIVTKLPVGDFMVETKTPPEVSTTQTTLVPTSSGKKSNSPVEEKFETNPPQFDHELEIDFGNNVDFGSEIEINNFELPPVDPNQKKKHSLLLEFKVQNISGIVLLNRVPDDTHKGNLFGKSKDKKDNDLDENKNANRTYDQRGAMYFAVSVVSVYGLSIGVLIAITIRKDSLEDHEVKTFLRRRRKLFRRFKREEKRQAKIAVSHALAMAQTASLLMAVPKKNLDHQEGVSDAASKEQILSKDQASVDLSSSSL